MEKENKYKKNNRKDGNLQLFIVFLLILLFIIILYFSVSNSNVKENYKFKNNLNINSLDELDNLNLGNLTIQNNGLITSRVKIKNLILCSEIFGKNSIKLNYFGENLNENYNYLFDSNYNNYIDLDVNEKKFLNINLIYYDKYYLINKLKNFDTNSTKISFKEIAYIYEIDNNRDNYNYCTYAKISNSIKNISLNFSLEKSDLNKNYNKYY